MKIENIPTELKDKNNWVLWRTELRDEKNTKIPFNAQTEMMAKSSDSTTWTSFDEAVTIYNKGGYDGLGFCFDDDGIIGTDLDHCLDPKTGEIKEWANKIIKKLNSYTEISPSGTGIHIFASGKMPEGGNRKGDFEQYSKGRYFTVTGDILPGSSEKVEDREKEIIEIHEEIFKVIEKKETLVDSSQPSKKLENISDDVLIKKAIKSKDDGKFKRLWKGDISGYNSPSDADFALCIKLAFWTGRDKERIERLFNQSELGKREKWANRQDYRDRTIQASIVKQTEVYSPRTFDFNACEIGTDICKDNHFKTLMGEIRNKTPMYQYKDGYYQKYGDTFITQKTMKILGENYKTHYSNEVVGWIRAGTFTHPKEINNDWINLKNGLINPSTGEFIKHTPTVFSLHQLPIEYDPEAKCPIFEEELKKRAINSTYDDEKGYDKEWKYKTIQEMFGYCFMKDQRHETAFLIYGPKRTFKSSLLFVLQSMLTGSDDDMNYSAMALQQLSNDIYAPALLFGKLANICADMESHELKNTGAFMKITGGDPITSGGKFQSLFTFRPFAKLIFCCNVIPPTRNKDSAFYRRWIPMEFSVQTKKDDVDTNFRENLLKELPGILNWTLEGHKRLVENKKFSCPYSDLEVQDIYERNSDSIQSFIFQKISTEYDNVEIIKREVYKKYCEYCKNQQPPLPIENIIKFGRVFIALSGCGSMRKGTIPAYSGICWKDDEPDNEGGGTLYGGNYD